MSEQEKERLIIALINEDENATVKDFHELITELQAIEETEEEYFKY